MANRISVDASTCVGCGLCEQACPEVFKVEDGIAKVIGSYGKGCSCNLKEVVEQCPVEAIKVE